MSSVVFLVIIAILVMGLVAAASIFYMAYQDNKRRRGAPTRSDIERDIVMNLLIASFVPENLKQKVDSYMRGEIDLDELKEVMATVVKPGSGFVKYAQKKQQG